MPPAPTMGWMCEKGARLSPPGSCSAAWRVPCGEEEGLGGDGALRKINANPCHFLGLVTGGGLEGYGVQGNQRRARHWL